MNHQAAAAGDLEVFNYCASFIDLLAQRVALRGQQLVPQDQSEAARIEFRRVLDASVLSIKKIHDLANQLIDPLVAPNPGSPLRASLPAEQRAGWDEMMITKVYKQRWSDGLLCFASLADAKVKCKVNNIFAILGHAGASCLYGLVLGQPIRGAVEIAWGVELYAGELYGAVLARAYELESEVARYPRIVVGINAYRFLWSHSTSVETDLPSQNNRELAKKCLAMLAEDEDGRLIVDYLGAGFREAITQGQHGPLYAAARVFVDQEYKRHRTNLDAKLAPRYAWLSRYFDARAANAK